MNGFLRTFPIESAAPSASRRQRAAGSAALADPSSDQLHLSDLGEALTRLSENSDVRAGKLTRIAKIRAAIAEGSYGIGRKIDAVVNHLLG